MSNKKTYEECVAAYSDCMYPGAPGSLEADFNRQIQMMAASDYARQFDEERRNLPPGHEDWDSEDWENYTIQRNEEKEEEERLEREDNARREREHEIEEGMRRMAERKCPICGIYYPRISGKARHLAYHRRQEEDIGRLWYCDFCNKEFLTRRVYRQ